MRSIEWSEQAGQELEDILSYWTERNKSDAFSRKLAQMIYNQLQFCARFHSARISLPYHPFNYIVVKWYAIYYTTSQDALMIHHIWDQRRDPNDNPLLNVDA